MLLLGAHKRILAPTLLAAELPPFVPGPQLGGKPVIPGAIAADGAGDVALGAGKLQVALGPVILHIIGAGVSDILALAGTTHLDVRLGVVAPDPSEVGAVVR